MASNLAIIIPSKNIYDKQFLKKNDNIIDNVQATITKVVETKEPEAVVYTSTETPQNETVRLISASVGKGISVDIDSDDTSGEIKHKAWGNFAWCGFENGKAVELSIQIPKHQYNSYVRKPISSPETPIKCSLFGKIAKGKFESSFAVSEKYEFPNNFFSYNYTIEKRYDVTPPDLSTAQIENDVYFSLPDNISFESKSQEKTGTVTVSKKRPIFSTLASTKFVEDDNYFSCNITVDTSVTIRTAELQDTYDEWSEDTTKHSPDIGGAFTMVGDYTTYITESFEITVYGIKIGIDLQTLDYTYKNGNSPFRLPENEILQSENTIGGEKHADYMSKKIIEKYKDGKSTLELLCGINDYYDDSGAKVIDVNSAETKKTFEHNDIVIPMVRSPQGTDKPINGSYFNSSFRVVNTEFVYDGAVYQKLLLEENV